MLARQTETAITLEIPFRGTRDYVHSTDLFAALDEFGNSFPRRPFLKSLALRRPARRQVQVHFEPQSDAFGTFALATPEHVIPGWLMESRIPISRHIAFDEQAVAREAIIAPSAISLRAPVHGYTGFEQMIILFKLLCAQSRPGVWLFTALELTQPLRSDAAISLRQSQKIFDRMIVADLHQADRPIGCVQMVLSQAAGNTS